MAVTLTLGGIEFRDMEIPDEMAFGGEQQLVLQKLGAGKRDIQAMGADEDDIPWQGRFRGGDAMARANQLDAMRIAGRSVPLSWGPKTYQVVIRHFRAKAQQTYEISYSICCVVIANGSSPTTVAGTQPGQASQADLTTLQGLASTLGISGLSGSVNDLQTAVGEVGGFAGAKGPTVARLQNLVGNVQGSVSTAINVQNGIVAATGTVAGMAAGGDPVALGKTLLNQASAFAQLGPLLQARGTAGRLLTNINNAGVGI